MKRFTVELQRTSYITIYVEAENKEQAEELAWDDLLNGRGDVDDAQWDVSNIEESD